MFAASKTSTPSGGTPDPQFNYVTMLLHGDGTNGAQNNTFLDSSTNNFTITRNGNTTQGSFSPYGSNWSNYFGIADSTNRSLSISPSGLSAMTTWTIECFTYSQNGSWNDQVILGPWTPNLIRTSLEVLEVYLAGSQRFAVANGLPKNQWNHLAICCDSSGLRLYVNGTRIGNNTGLPNLSISLASMIIGAETTTSTANDRWNGYISNFRVLNGTALYTGATYTVPTTALTAITNTVLLTCQSNRFKDSSANNWTITVNGTPSVQRFNPFGASTAYSTSVIGGSGYFDGSGDYLETPTSSAFAFGTGDFTSELWVYLSRSNGTVIYEPRTSSNESNPCIAYGVLTANKFEVANSAIIITSSSTFGINQWHHVALVRSGTTLTLWVNGTNQGSTTLSTNLTNNDRIRIGEYFNAGTYALQGYVSNLRVVKGTAVYTSAFTPSTTPLTAISGTSLLTSMTNGAIFDNAMMNDLETGGNAQIYNGLRKFGTGSIYLDGTTGTVLRRSNTPLFQMGTGNFTIEFWANLADQGTGGFFAITSMGNSSLNIQNQFGTFNVQYEGIANIINFDISPYYGSWNFFAVVRNNGVTTVYVNGTSVASASDTSNYQGSSDFVIGNRSGGGYLNAYIDDFRITKGYARYTANFTPPTAAFPNTGPI